MDYPHFTDKELSCSCCGINAMDHSFMLEMERIRTVCDFPFIVTSAYRCPDYNKQVSSTGLDGPHTTGRAIDILVSGEKAFKLLQVASQHKITRFGVAQKGPHETRFIHLDNLPNSWVWSY